MSLMTILVNLADEENAETLLNVAVPLARKHGAHLVGLHVIEALMVHPNVAIHMPPTVHRQFTARQQKAADAIKAIYQKLTRAEAFPTEFRLVTTETTSAASRILESARAADLIITVQERSSWEYDDHLDDEIRTIRESGRPVIVVPPDYDGPEIGNQVLLGWSDTREATRAAHDVVSLSLPDTRLDILRIAPPADEFEDHCTLDVAKAFSRHGLHVEVIQRARDSRSVAEMLQHEALEKGADLIAVGAFGHSRLYDFTIGAVSRDLLANAKLPVLYSK